MHTGTAANPTETTNAGTAVVPSETTTAKRLASAERVHPLTRIAAKRLASADGVHPLTRIDSTRVTTCDDPPSAGGIHGMCETPRDSSAGSASGWARCDACE